MYAAFEVSRVLVTTVEIIIDEVNMVDVIMDDVTMVEDTTVEIIMNEVNMVDVIMELSTWKEGLKEKSWRPPVRHSWLVGCEGEDACRAPNPAAEAFYLRHSLPL